MRSVPQFPDGGQAASGRLRAQEQQMNAVILMLLAFVGLGLGNARLGRLSYVGMGLVILLYLGYAYYTG